MYKGKTQRNTSFEDWWKMVVECYKESFPNSEQFKNDPVTKMKYAHQCYMAGDDPESALNLTERHHRLEITIGY